MAERKTEFMDCLPFSVFTFIVPFGFRFNVHSFPRSGFCFRFSLVCVCFAVIEMASRLPNEKKQYVKYVARHNTDNWPRSKDRECLVHHCTIHMLCDVNSCEKAILFQRWEQPSPKDRMAADWSIGKMLKCSYPWSIVGHEQYIEKKGTGSVSQTVLQSRVTRISYSTGERFRFRCSFLLF